MGYKLTEAKPAEKLLSLFTTLLFNNRKYSLSDLAAMLGCSKQTVSRLITQMESAKYGKIDKEKRGKEVFFKLLRPERLPAISLDGEGLSQLVLCRDFLVNLLPKKMQTQMQKSLEVAVSYLPAGNQNMPGSVGASLSKGHINYEPFQEYLETMMRAIRSNRVCLVRYRRSLNKAEKEYDYAPKRLVAYRESIFILGYLVTDKGTAVPKHNDQMPLALHRMTGCVLTRRTSEHVPDVPPPPQDAFGIMVKGEPFAVMVKFAPSAATYVTERQWSANQQVERCDDGSVLLRIQAANEPECLSWVLGFGEKAELLEPTWLRDKIAQIVAEMQATYTA